MGMREILEKSYITVSKDGSGDYKTVQEAVDSVCNGNCSEVVIKIAPGTYYEKITVDGNKTHITMIGEDAKTTILTFNEHAGKLRPNGDITSTFRTGSLEVRGNWFHGENLTIENSYDGSGEGGKQAVACFLSGEHISFVNCRFIGRQDTLYTKEGSHYFKDCYIEGDVDFIFGGARAVFYHCIIHSFRSSKGYICAPSTSINQKYGYLFLDCIVEGDSPDNTVFLGRPWHPGLNPYAAGNAVFMYCELGKHIQETGWSDMGGYLCKNARFFEYKNTGAGAVINDNRRQLTLREAKEYTIERVLGWNPDFERGGL